MLTAKGAVISGIAIFLLGLLLGGAGVYYATVGRINAGDRELADSEQRNRDLDRDYQALRVTEASLRDDIERRREIDGRARDQIAGIGRTIGELQSQGTTIAGKIRVIIEALKGIQERVRNLENLYNSGGSDYSH